MIRADEHRQALRAINYVLVYARLMAYEQASHQDLAYVLDIAEYLPMLMLEERDCTSRFRDQLEGLAARLPSFGVALERFDHEPAPGECP
ncbi:MAG: hypothetical protein U0230_28275 [Polyangiales bacterium]